MGRRQNADLLGDLLLFGAIGQIVHRVEDDVLDANNTTQPTQEEAAQIYDMVTPAYP